MESELPSAIQLTQMCGLQPEIAAQFTDIWECDAAFQKYSMDAWKVAILYGLWCKSLKISLLSTVKDSEPEWPNPQKLS